MREEDGERRGEAGTVAAPSSSSSSTSVASISPLPEGFRDTPGGLAGRVVLASVPSLQGEAAPSEGGLQPTTPPSP